MKHFKTTQNHKENIMKLDRNELLKQITVKQEVFEVPSWNNVEVTMTINNR